MNVITIHTVRVGQIQGRTKAKATTAEDANTNGLRRPTLSDNGPETTVEMTMATRLRSPMIGMTVSGSSTPR